MSSNRMCCSLVVHALVAAYFFLSSSAVSEPRVGRLSGELDGDVTLWVPYLEWSFDNPTFVGNPFDLVATVTFTHSPSGNQHVTEMFFDGDTTWKVRFAGTRLGTWTALSASNDPELDGLTGTIEVTRGTARYGFVDQLESPSGTKWARQTGPEDVLQTFVPQFLMYYGDPKTYENNPEEIATTLTTFFDEHGFNGFHVPHVGGRWFDIEGDEVVEGDNVDPDLRMFRALELLITTTHAAGGVVHIWAWGDQARRWTPTELAGGINGLEDQRLQRAIAARLGPIAGWTLGYGFDLDEWAPENELHTWRDFVQEHLGWFHYLGGRPLGPNSGTDHSPWENWNLGVDYSSYEHHEPDFDVYIAAMEAVAGQPVFSEDRYRVRGFDGIGKDYTTEQTRRGLWQSAMAGGVANIWGNFTRPDGTVIPLGLSLSYPEPEWSKTYSVFFENGGRFRNDFERAPDLTDGSALRSPQNEHFVFYVEGASTIDLDLSAMVGEQPAVLVDTATVYDEIDLGLLLPLNQTLDLPATSDWAVAVGKFASVPVLALSGSCPGEITVTAAGATPFGTVAILRSMNEGSSTLPAGPCTGVSVELNSPTLVTVATADANGTVSFSRNAPASACGRYLQAVDQATCAKSSVAQIPQ